MLPRPGMKNSTNEMKQANNGLLKRKIDAPLPHGTLFIYLLKGNDNQILSVAPALINNSSISTEQYLGTLFQCLYC